jgi:hypothetical protein
MHKRPTDQNKRDSLSWAGIKRYGGHREILFYQPYRVCQPCLHETLRKTGESCMARLAMALVEASP